jgi:5-formyltetrahydrofolate cyclo-ligase
MAPEPAPLSDPVGGAALHDAKRAMRERVLAARDAWAPAERRAASQSIAAAVAGLPSYAAASTVLLTLPFRSEWDTRTLVGAALDAGKTVVLPRVVTDARMLVLHAIRDPAGDVDAGYRGIPEPRPGCPVVAPQSIDWALVPGVAFDAAGGRLGYGGGFYDRLLPLFAPDVARVAGAFALQLVDRVPTALHDLRVHAIVTERQTIVASGE